MGTRHLTVVYLDGEYKVAQYGQWDGYPEGAGINILEFMRDKVDMEKFKTAVRNCSYTTDDQVEELWKKYAPCSEEGITSGDLNRFGRDYPQFHRDTGSDILEIIQSHPEGIELQNSINFAADSLFCEWAWVVDLDAGILEAYEGVNKIPLDENDRFYFLERYKAGDDFYQVRLVAKWSLDDLPSNEDFLAEFETSSEAED